MALEKAIIKEKYKNAEDFIKHEKGKHFCLCGCNQAIELKKSHYWNGIPGFIFGHAARLRQGAKNFDRNLFYCVEDIAAMANVSDQTVRLWNRSNLIKASVTAGRKNLYAKDDIDKFLKKRPPKASFDGSDYYTIQDLKDMGVSRSKLRALVRAGTIHEPRHHARKTHYLRIEIDRHLKEIADTQKPATSTPRMSPAVVNKLKDRIADLEARVKMLEDCLLSD